MMFLWILIICILIYLLLGGRIDFKVFQKKDAYDLLDARLAKGEISVEEYQEIKKVIEEENK